MHKSFLLKESSKTSYRRQSENEGSGGKRCLVGWKNGKFNLPPEVALYHLLVGGVVDEVVVLQEKVDGRRDGVRKVTSHHVTLGWW